MAVVAPFPWLPVNDNDSLVFVLLLVMAVTVVLVPVDAAPLVVVDSITAIDFRRVISRRARFSDPLSVAVRSALRLRVGENSGTNERTLATQFLAI